MLKTFPVALLVICIDAQQLLGQVADDFSDGDFKHAPVWLGDTLKFGVSASKLQLQAPPVNGVAYLSTANVAFYNASWEFSVTLDFNPASGNHARVYLSADQSNLAGGLNGYYVLIGDTPDEISLYRQTANTRVKIIDGADARVNLPTVNARIRVTRDAVGNWQLFSDVGSTGTYTQEGSVLDVTHTTSAFMGVYCVYTSTRSDKFFFDDFTVTGEAFIDLAPPQVDVVEVLADTALRVGFSEPVSAESAEDTSRYAVSHSIGSPVNASLAMDRRSVILVFSESFPNGIGRSIIIQDVSDEAGNVMTPVSKDFLFFQAVTAVKRDIIISELLPDPSPPIGMPESEFIEIFNRSGSPFDLAGWQVTDGSSIGTLSSLMLLPGEYLILTSNSARANYESIGRTMGLAVMPSQNNSSDAIRLISPEGTTIDSVAYFVRWHSSAEKEDGGWSLERIDPEDECRGALNWTSSLDSLGGTPGGQNSVFANTPDLTGPKLEQVIFSSDSLVFQFDEKLADTAPEQVIILAEPTLVIDSLWFADTTLENLVAALGSEADSSQTYAIRLEGVFDCPGNPIQPAFASFSFKLDTIPPEVQSISVTGPDMLSVTFSEKVNSVSAEAIGNYALFNGNMPVTATLAADKKTVLMQFHVGFENGVHQILIIKDVADRANNTMLPDTVTFLHFVAVAAQEKDIVMTEIFADPAPVIGLPEAEFIELYNRSANPFDLAGWKITDGSGIGILSPFILLPAQYLVLCSNASRNAYAQLGRTMGLQMMPSLNNSSDDIRLINPAGVTIDSVRYSATWYGDDEKKDGGWTLELIDPEDRCRGAMNWTASRHAAGGTPGFENAVFAHMTDSVGPRLLDGSLVEGNLKLVFSEKLGSVSSGDFVLEPPLEIDSVWFVDESKTSLLVSLPEPIDSAITYIIYAAEVRDCPGNLIQPDFSSIRLKADTVSPQIASVNVADDKTLAVRFTERMDSLSLIDFSHYYVSDQISPVNIVVSADGKGLTIVFSEAFINGVGYELLMEAVADRSGNKLEPVAWPFMHFQPVAAGWKDVIITEIFADPSPQIGLPEVEFIELYNRSANPFQLAGWRIADATSTAVLPPRIILPGSYLILCPATKAHEYFHAGEVAGVAGFPSLSNAGEKIKLTDAGGVLIDSLNYSSAWFDDPEKEDGGWTIELVDPENVCAEGGNWMASEDQIGGTPGRRNSVFGSRPDLSGPALLSAIPLSDSVLLLQFSEKLEKTLFAPEQFTLAPHAEISGVAFADAALTSLYISVSGRISGGTAYNIIADVYDCAGNRISGEFNKATFGLPERAVGNDIVINEVLFNPTSTGVDFVEVYNRSAKFINLRGWTLANMSADSSVNRMILSGGDYLFAPDTYLVFTPDANLLKGEYLQGREETFFVTNLPPLPDDEGSVALADELDNMIDALQYSDSFHSPFVQDAEGVSLERISFGAPASDPFSWRSASSVAGFATPGYLNSNARSSGIPEEAIRVSPEIFAPLSGQSDFTQIAYRFEQGGYVANVRIVDPQGREIKRIANNALLGTEGFFRWDGDRDNGTKARTGAYIVWFDVFNASGSVHTYRKRVVVAAQR